MPLNNNTLLVTTDNKVITFGLNNNGQCGIGNTNTPQLSLYTIPDINNVKQISCGYNHTVFLLNNGTVKTVGHNAHGQCGTGNTTTQQLSLYAIPDLTNVKQVACGGYHTVFLLNDGTVKTVGHNQYGQCGTGKATTTSPYTQSLYTIPNLTNVKQIACGYNYTVFLLDDGTVKTVGNNSNGQCGTGNTTSPQLSLYTIPNLNNVKQISCGYSHTVFLLNDGTVKALGSNTYGQCGTNSTASPQLQLYTIPNLTNVKQISCGDSFTVFLLNDGTVRTVGQNANGQCGTGNAAIGPTYAQLSLYTIPNLNNVKQVTCGYSHTIFLLNDNTIKTVGNNGNGQCGTRNTTSPQLSLYTIPDLNIKSLYDTYNIRDILYLIKRSNSYYSIKPEYYNTSSRLYEPLSIQDPLSNDDITQYGFDISNLTKDITIDNDTFRPIDKLYSKFDIKAYK